MVQTQKLKRRNRRTDSAMNTLYYGDNLDVLRRHVVSESVDLIYLDPPFKSNQDFNVLFKEQDGSRSAAQIKAFKDTWRWDQAAAAAFEEVTEAGGQISATMQGFQQILGTNDMLAYLAMMAPRLVELRRVLKSTGSIYLHCDPTAGHYLKILMDAIFGPTQFRNEIVWCHYGGGQSKRFFPRKHDTIFFYTKDKEWIFNSDAVRVPYDSDYTATVFRGENTRAPGRVYKPNPKGKVVEDFWTISRPYGKEHLGYPTQKPEALLDRIIRASSNEGDVVLDPFCGCGTAIAVAQKLNRQWLGIDVTYLAITLIKHRFKDAFGDETKLFDVLGEPVALPGAKALAAEDPYQFQWWALGFVGARPVEQKKGADKGIDGRLYFHDEPEGGKTKQVIFSVKAGKPSVAHVRDLRGVIEREKAAIGAFLTMQPSTGPMRTEAASAGFYDSPLGTKYPRLQILTVEELLAGKTVDMPPTGGVQTFKRAPKAR